MLILAVIFLSTFAIVWTLPHTDEMWLLIILTYGFMWLEYINYFHVRLSYLTPREFRQLLTNRKVTASHLNRAMKGK
ncbi:hypothetical protein GCM10007190_18850 [Macrococcus hajekii]|nr:hypothetical protein GCM10007190_18850 [Macrococcus hajekii]